VASIVMEGFRRVDEWRLIEESIHRRGVYAIKSWSTRSARQAHASRAARLDAIDGQRTCVKSSPVSWSGRSTPAKFSTNFSNLPRTTARGLSTHRDRRYARAASMPTSWWPSIGRFREATVNLENELKHPWSYVFPRDRRTTTARASSSRG
jgi:hypothetical protein